MSEVFVAVMRDRHSGISVEVFSDLGDVVKFARGTAHEFARDVEDINEGFYRDGTAYISYSCDGEDIITINRVKVDARKGEY